MKKQSNKPTSTNIKLSFYVTIIFLDIKPPGINKTILTVHSWYWYIGWQIHVLHWIKWLERRSWEWFILLSRSCTLLDNHCCVQTLHSLVNLLYVVVHSWSVMSLNIFQDQFSDIYPRLPLFQWAAFLLPILEIMRITTSGVIRHFVIPKCLPFAFNEIIDDK